MTGKMPILPIKAQDRLCADHNDTPSDTPALDPGSESGVTALFCKTVGNFGNSYKQIALLP